MPVNPKTVRIKKGERTILINEEDYNPLLHSLADSDVAPEEPQTDGEEGKEGGNKEDE